MMASDGMLSLSWNNHKTTFCHILSTLREKERYTDVTLACEGKFYPVHKLVLSTCSEYFEKMFDNTPCKHPIVVLKDIKCADIEALLSYMYAGVVSVLQQDLARLIKAAELLQIKGLAVPDEPPVKETVKKNSYPWSARDDRSSPHPKRRRREDSTASIPLSSIQPSESPPSSPPHQDSNKSWEQSKSLGQDQRSEDVPDQRQGEQPEPTVDYNSTKQELTVSQDQSEETLVKEEIVDAGDDNQGEVLDSRIEYGTLGAGDGSEEQANKYPHLDPKHPQPLHEAVVEALAGPSGMQGWLGTGELGGGFSMLEGYSEDGSQDLHSGSAHGSQQSHQMVWMNNDTQIADQGGTTEVQKNLVFSRKFPKTYQCSECFYSTINRCDLVKHKRTHTGSKPFSCPYCSYQTGDKSNLKQHLRTHTGEKPFACPYCTYRATRRSSIKNHMRTHL